MTALQTRPDVPLFPQGLPVVFRVSELPFQAFLHRSPVFRNGPQHSVANELLQTEFRGGFLAVLMLETGQSQRCVNSWLIYSSQLGIVFPTWRMSSMWQEQAFHVPDEVCN